MKSRFNLSLAQRGHTVPLALRERGSGGEGSAQGTDDSSFRVVCAMCVSIALLCAALMSSIVSAAEFSRVQANESTVTFAYRQMGVNMDGKFGNFTAQAAFDPARLGKAQARIEINLASIDTGVAEADDEVKGNLWFNTRAFPTASFVSIGVKPLGGNRYEAAGKLTIKGKTLDVVTPFSFEANGARGIFDGQFTIRRLDYNIGEGIWDDVSAVADEIRIKFHLVVTAAPGNK